MPTLYKFLDKKGRSLVSRNGGTKWKIGEWQSVNPDELDICNYGFHGSKKVYEAFSYVPGDVLAVVEVGGQSIKQSDKQCWSEMRIVKAYKWTKKDSVALAIYSAELVLKNFEKQYPDDMRPREAIEAAKQVLFKDTKRNRDAAGSAAWSAAGSAAWSAAWSAAGSAAGSAAWSAAWSAAAAAAWSAARSALIRKIDRWMVGRIKELEEL